MVKRTMPLTGRGTSISYEPQKGGISVTWGKLHFFLDEEMLDDILANYFTNPDEWYLLGANETGAPPGSFGEYISKKYPALTPRHGSAIAALLVNENLLEYRGARPIELKKI